MSASQYRHTCSQLGVCQQRPGCSAQAERDSEGHQSAVRIERLVNSRHRHVVHERMPLHRAGVEAQPADDEAPQRSPRAFVAFWACYLGLLIVVVGLLVHHFVAR